MLHCRSAPRILNVVPGYVEEERLHGHRLHLGRPGDEILKVDGARCGVLVQSLDDGRSVGEMGLGDGYGAFAELGQGDNAAVMGVEVLQGRLQCERLLV